MMEGHIEGMLDRDQRTVKFRTKSLNCICDCSVNQENLQFVQQQQQLTIDDKIKRNVVLNQPNTCKMNCFTTQLGYDLSHKYLIRKNRYFWTCIQRIQKLKQLLLLVGICLSLLIFPCGLAAPATSAYSKMHSKETPRWINPCGVQLTGESDRTPGNSISDAEMLENIVTQAEIACNKAEDVRNEFAPTFYKMDPAEVHELFKNQHYDDWLPDWHKQYGEQVPEAHLNSLELNRSLLDAYHNLQRIAVSIESAVSDLEKHQEPMVKQFKDTEDHLRNVLCEIQMTIMQRNIVSQMYPDVQREDMPDKYKTEGSGTDRKARNWIFLREYINGLQYIIQSFGAIRSKL